MARRGRKPKVKVPRYELIDRESVAGKPIYALLDKTVKKHHEDLKDARIAVAWMIGKKKDADGKLKLGQLKKASELDRELHGLDLVVLLNKEMWHEFSDAQRAALIDHELCHVQIAYDNMFEPKTDAKGRTMYRIRKHDIEEFNAVIHRHGLYKSDIESFAAAIDEGKQLSLPAGDGKAVKKGKAATAEAREGF